MLGAVNVGNLITFDFNPAFLGRKTFPSSEHFVGPGDVELFPNISLQRVKLGKNAQNRRSTADIPYRETGVLEGDVVRPFAYRPVRVRVEGAHVLQRHWIC